MKIYIGHSKDFDFKEELYMPIINSKLNELINYSDIKNEIISVLSSFTYEKTGRKPIILPVIMDIKKNS